jgi:vancomycin resistance protein VanW
MHATPLLRKLKDVDMYLQYNKIHNLKIAVKKLNHVVIHPGETFSYWRLIGKPTAKKGYKEGIVLFYGTCKKGIGGGLCQLSNMIYWLTLHTPLSVIERYRHSFDVFPDSDRNQPFGSGATCVFNYRDLMIFNGTNQSFELLLEVTDDQLIGIWKSDKPVDFSYDVYEKEHIMKSEFWGGCSRHNKLYRKIFDINGYEIADEYITENHALMMYNPFLSQ